jgi:heme A synthase
MSVAFAAVELGQLLDVVWASLLASVVVTTIFAVVIRESGRAAEARRTGNGNATLHVAMAVLGVVAFAAIVVVGVAVMLNK